MSRERYHPIPEENPEEERRKLDEFREKEAAREAARKAEAQKSRASVSYGERITKNARPTPKQIELLNEFGVEVLPTKLLNTRQIGFILNGNGAEPPGLNKYERAAYLKKAQAEWQGKKITRPEGDKGVVRYVFPKFREEVNEERKRFTDKRVSVCKATVDFGDKEALVTKVMQLASLQKEEPGTENENGPLLDKPAL